MNKYIDAHCHIVSNPSVGAICNAATVSDWGRVALLQDIARDIYGAIGVHPWFVHDLPHGWAQNLEAMLSANPELLVGEIGLDKHRPDIDTQLSVFTSQLDIAHNMKRGICLHCVGAWERIAHILKTYRNKLPRFILAHAYSGPINLIERMASEYNMFFSYGPRNLLNSSRIIATPHPRILAETDSDTPSGVIDVIGRISDMLDIYQSKMADIIYSNTIRMLQDD